MSYPKTLLALLCASACALAGGAIATAGDDPAPDPAPEIVDASSPPVTTVEPEQAEEIRQLRRDRTSDDALPTGWRDKLAGGGHWGANPGLSRRTAPGVWIVPGNDYVCLASTSGDGGLGFGCATPEDVERGLLAPSDVDANGNGVLTGALPDGVAEVTLVDKDGARRSVPVERNTYRAAIDANIKEVRFTGPDGGDHVLPMAWQP
jgi:hypothetical protein